MDTKHIGTIGELAVAEELMRRGWEVFTEMGDNSKIDLIANKDGLLRKIQVKTVEFSDCGWVFVRKSKITNGIRIEYLRKDIDLFAIYVMDKDAVAFVPFSKFKKKSLCLRFEKPRSGRTSLMFNDFSCADVPQW